MLLPFFALLSCKDNISSNDRVVATTSDEVEMDSLSPYWYDKNQREVTFSESGDTLLRYPHDVEVDEYLVPASVKCIFERAFQGCRNLKKVVVPETVRHIEMAAFNGCEDLRQVFLYAPLDTMPYRLLNGCDNLREIHVASEVPPVVEEYEEDEMYSFRIVFGNADLDSLVLFVPRDAIQKYKKAYGWRMFKNIVSLQINN
jgi:hypothetical protein